MPLVVFTAPCPECGSDARWTQEGGSGYTVNRSDFTIRCLTCDPPIA